MTTYVQPHHASRFLPTRKPVGLRGAEPRWITVCRRKPKKK